MVMTSIPREKQRCWEDLVAAISRESEMSGGFGELVVSIKFHKGQPQDLRVLERRPQYRLGGGLPRDDGSWAQSWPDGHRGGMGARASGVAA
jgi:hypothetical protein